MSLDNAIVKAQAGNSAAGLDSKPMVGYPLLPILFNVLGFNSRSCASDHDGVQGPAAPPLRACECQCPGLGLGACGRSPGYPRRSVSARDTQRAPAPLAALGGESAALRRARAGGSEAGPWLVRALADRGTARRGAQRDVNA
eukprot:3912150-Rhodomonas_salina.2